MSASEKESISLAILAGGKSRRFGGKDKQGIRFRGEALGRVVAKNALLAGTKVLVVGNDTRPYMDLDVDVVRDLRPGYGPLSGLHAALSYCDSDWVYLMACDVPFFKIEWYRYLAECSISAEAMAICAMREGHFEPFHALYSRRILSFLDSFFDNPSIDTRSLSFRALLSSIECRIIPEATARGFSSDWELFKGANSFEELAFIEGENWSIDRS